MQTHIVIRRTRKERQPWYAGAHYCEQCSSTSLIWYSTFLTWSGTVCFDARKQEWGEAGGDVDNCYCTDCQNETRGQWYSFIQINLWDDKELFDVNS